MAYRLGYSDYPAPPPAPSPAAPPGEPATVPGGPSFGGSPQPPDVPCDPTGDGWRGPPGAPGAPGPAGPTDAYVINVKDAAYGAVGDGTTNDAAAFQAALAAAAAGGKVIAPAGTYNIGAALSQAITGSVTFEGAGSGVTILAFSNATDGIAFSLSVTANVHVRAMTIARTASGAVYANTGLSITSPQGAGSNRPGLTTVYDVDVQGNATRTTAWATGLNIVDVTGDFSALRVLAPDADGSTALGVGVSIAGSSLASFVADIAFENLTIQGGSKGLVIGDFVQGVYLVNSRLIGVDYGIYWRGVAGHSDIALFVGNSHLNAGTRAVYVFNTGGIQIVNSSALHFHTPTSLTGDWDAFEIHNTNTGQISNCNVFGWTAFTGTENGVLLQDGNLCTVTGNVFSTLLNNGVVLSGVQSQSTITGNVGASLGGTCVSDTTGNASNVQIANVTNGVPDTWPTVGAVTVNATNVNATNAFVHGLFMGTASSAGVVIMQGPNASNRETQYFTGAQSGPDLRWKVGVTGNSESGSNVGSDFHFTAIGDTGAQLGNPILINRATQLVTFGNQIAFSGAALPTNAANDAAAASAGVAIGGVYRNGSALQVRVA